MDELVLKGLQFKKAYHGFYEQERKDGNHFEVDVFICANFKNAGSNDTLDKTINYEEICHIVKSVMEGPSKMLIETLAKTIGDKLFHSLPKAQKITISLRKLAPPLDIQCSYSEISMSWKR